jgi:hypothetical protein
MVANNDTRHHILITLLLISFCGSGTLVGAADSQQTSPQPTAPSPADSPPPASTPGGASGSTASTPQQNKQLQAGVQKIEISLKTLRDVGLDLKHLLKSVSGLYDEVTIRPVTIITEPEVVGRGIMINIPVGTMPTGPVEPPRKDRVDQSMSEIRPVITFMKKNVDAFVSGNAQLDLPPDVQQQLQPQIKAWTGTVDDLSAHLNNLEQLTQGPTYSNDAIAAATTAMQQDIKNLDQTRRDIYKGLRDEGKHRAHWKL